MGIHMFVEKLGYYVYEAFQLRETYFMKQKNGKEITNYYI